MEKKDLEKMDIYNLAMDLGEAVWQLVLTWDEFAQDTMSRPYVQNVDAIASNIASGYGRQSPNEKRNYTVFARSAALSTKVWLEKAYRRGLVEEETYQHIKGMNEKMIGKLYGYVNFLEEKGGATPVQSIRRKQKLKKTKQETT